MRFWKPVCKMEQGLIHIYCGDGKGKTTACLGLSIRCAGHGNKVLFVQFLKSRLTGELKSLELLSNIEVLRGKETKEVLREHMRLFARIKTKLEQEEVRLLVLDEVIGACNTGVFDEEQLIDFLKNKPQSLEVVLSGRKPSSALLDLADYVSEVCKRKHPFDNGIPARVGIEK